MNIRDKYRHWRRKMKFNSQYRRGKWNKLAGEKESVRYLKIDQFLHQYQPKRILDLGCGDGVLNRRMSYNNFDYFKGIDYAPVSIEKAKKQNFPKAEFETQDLLSFDTDETFDMIILNEAFYYIHETERQNVLRNILKSLAPDGVLVVSIFREGATCWEHFQENSMLKEESFETVESKLDDTYWKLGVYRIREN